MSGKLNWEAASRASRMSHSGSESVYRGLASGGSTGGGELAIYAYEQAAKRAAGKARKTASRLAARQANIEDRRIRRKKVHEEELKQCIAESAANRWQELSDPKLECAIFRIDSLINKLGIYNERTPLLVAAHTRVVDYMDALRIGMKATDDYQDDELFVTKIQNTSRNAVASHLSRKVQSCNARDREQLHTQIERSLKKVGDLSNRGKEYFTGRLIAERVIVLTPSARVLYFSKYTFAVSN